MLTSPSLTKIAPTSKAKFEKLLYIDNIKIMLTLLVVLHHACITYGGSGGWYLKEATHEMGALIPMTLFVSLNQSYFMGFFFLLAAYFTYSSYHRKGPEQFITDRLVRLGIPLLFYSFVLSPFLSFMVYHWGKGHTISYIEYLHVFDGWIDFGVLWFVAALLFFTLVYVLCAGVTRKWVQKPRAAPGTGTILFAAVILGLITFLIRIVFPVGWVLKPLGFQLGHFPQYISLFVAGLLASKNNWFDQLPLRMGKQMLGVALSGLLFFPVFYLLRIKLDLPMEWYSGGFNLLSLLYSVWEQCIGFSIITAFLCFGKQYWNGTTPLISRLSRSAFAVYIFHPLVLIALSIAFLNWTVDPALKLLFVAPLSVLGSFLFGLLILFIPGTKRVV
jgi:surface polysaccharide O-acyltransferase-like enzyme